MSLPRFVVLSSLVLVLAACAVPVRDAVPAPEAVTPAYHGDAARPAEGRDWVRTELYFAVAAWDASPEASAEAERRWLDFLDREVTPRFPDGLSVLDAYGQWLPPGASEPTRLRSKELVIQHADTAERREAIEAIRLAWKSETGHRSVLRSRLRADVSF